MPGECVDLGAVGPHILQMEVFGLGEVFRTAEDPPGDGPGRGRAGCHRPRGGAFLVEVGANALVAALIAERHDLLP